MSFTATIPSYLPDVKYFAQFLNSKYILFADHFQYTKRSSITRSTNLANNVQLVIPVIHNGYKKCISEKQIADIENWSNKHLKTIHHLYNKCPFFEEYFTEIETIYRQKAAPLNLFLFNTTSFFINKLKIKSKLVSTSKLGFNANFENSIIDFAIELNLKKYYYKTEEISVSIKDALLKSKIKPIELDKNLNNKFFNVNVLEFLFRFGPEAAFLIREN